MSETTANIGLISLYNARKLRSERLLTHSVADAVTHKPRRFVSHAKHPVNLMRTHSFFGSAEKVNGDHPFVERDMRIFEDRANSNSERLAASFTLPQTLTRLAHSFGLRSYFALGLILFVNLALLWSDFVSFTYKATMRTLWAFRPALLLKV